MRSICNRFMKFSTLLLSTDRMYNAYKQEMSITTASYKVQTLKGSAWDATKRSWASGVGQNPYLSCDNI